MARNHEIKCQCGRKLTIQFDESCPLLRIFCHGCNAMIFNLSQPQPTQIKNTPVANVTKCAKPANSFVTGVTSTHIKASPKKFGHYSILKCLGAGAMGKVYLAIDDKIGEKVALKILQKPEDQKILDYFLREMQVLMQLQHPNIVGLKGRGNFQGYPYIAMEFVSGDTLEGLLTKKGALAPLYAAKISFDVLSALEHAARLKIIHRDIKPGNIFITQHGQAKLIDLGLAKALDNSCDLTQTGQAMGTPLYMPLEQIQDAKRADCRSDIYAVGATMYHILCGVAPYQEFTKNIQKLFMAKNKSAHIPLQERVPGLSPRIIDITEKAMAHDPQQRYSNPTEMKNELLAFLQTLKS